MSPEGSASTMRGYRVTVRGDYYYLAEGNRKLLKQYEVEMNVPDVDLALSVIKNKLLEPALRRKYPDFMARRTFYVIDSKPLCEGMPKPKNVRVMNRAQLSNHIEVIQAPIVVDAYADIQDLRKVLQEFINSPELFKNREGTRMMELKENRELAALNPELSDDVAPVADAPLEEAKPAEEAPVAEGSSTPTEEQGKTEPEEAPVAEEAKPAEGDPIDDAIPEEVKTTEDAPAEEDKEPEEEIADVEDL